MHSDSLENLFSRKAAARGSPTSISRGSWNVRSTYRGGISEFTKFCTGNGIEHIVTSIRRPSTIGKIEAFHKAYTIEASIYPAHNEFVNYWNYERPHQGIGYLYPADVYFKDLLTDVGG